MKLFQIDHDADIGCSLYLDVFIYEGAFICHERTDSIAKNINSCCCVFVYSLELISSWFLFNIFHIFLTFFYFGLFFLEGHYVFLKMVVNISVSLKYGLNTLYDFSAWSNLSLNLSSLTFTIALRLIYVQ